MTDYAAYNGNAVDEAGNVVPSAWVEVRDEVGGGLATLYSDRTGGAKGNPFQVDSDGYFRFHVTGGVYKVRIYTGSSGAPTSERIHRYVGIGTASEYDRGEIIGIDEPVVVASASATIAEGTMAVVVQRAAPSATALTLPPVASRNGMPLKISDDSTSVTEHTITLTPDGSEKIMNLSTWELYSNAASLAGVTLIPSTTLGGWYIAP